MLVPLVRGQGPLRGQIETALRRAIRSGRLGPNSVLPSSRVLARDLGVSRGVVVTAYEQLVAEGFLVTRPGGRTVVMPRVKRVEWRVEADPPAPVRYDFKPGMPDVREFPHRDWNRATRNAISAATDRDLGYGDVRGSLPLRMRLAEYLGRVRAVDTTPNQLLICTGVTQALGLAVKALLAAGIRCVGVENPGQPDIYRIVAAAGARAVPVSVDEHGVVVRDLASTHARAVIVTPAHQFPSGGILSAQRRQELVAWAQACGGFIVEDDYDAEFRYDGTPVGAMQALAADRVVYVGSASKILAPALRLGWMGLPPRLLDAAVDAKKTADLGSPSLNQLVYAEFIASGGLDRHLRRMRPLYRGRRDALVRTLTGLHSWTVAGAAAGLHLVARLSSGTVESDVVRAAAARGVAFHPMSRYRRQRRPPIRQELVFGYGQFTEQEIEAGLRRALN